MRDNGTGISLDVRDKLFRPFVTTRPTGEGTGPRLSIAYDIVAQQHGETIDVAIAWANSPNSSFSILVLDDEPDVAEQFRQCFRLEVRQASM